MENLGRYKSIILSMICLFLFCGMIPRHAHGEIYAYDGIYCGIGAATPPFLSAGVDPNLLLIIDNSGSMLDLAYIDAASHCYDDTYDPAATYAGYFEATVWYGYDFNNDQFIKLTDAEAATYLSDADFKNSDVAISGTITNGELTSVTHFGARGNFLNWVMASKLDIQKEILTGGKYDATTQQLIMEARGCGEKRFVKSVAMTDSVDTGGYFLTLAIRPQREIEFDPWENGETYVVGDIVNDWGELYIASAIPNPPGTGVASGTSVSDDTGVTWAPYYGTRWHDGSSYPAGAIVSDPSKANTIDEGRLYITAAGGTAHGTGVDDDTGITDWVTYDLTHVEIFKVGTTGFNNDACEAAVAELASGGSQGTIKQDIEDCMGYESGLNQGEVSNFMAAFNHSIHNCWYSAKHGVWPPGAGPVQSIQPACEALYTAGIMPWDITTDSRGYVCFGVYDPDADPQKGYVGRCWRPGGGEFICTKTNPHTGECQKWEWSGSSEPAWDAAGYGSVDECIEAALQDYCGILDMPEVIDPSDQVGDDADNSGTFWNIPAVLIDSGVVAQLDEPIAILKGRILQSTAPTGLIAEFAEDIRMGVMIFNAEGSKYECSQADPFDLFDCGYSSNRDGGKIVADIDQSEAHTEDLIAAINDIKANSWTPIAEAFYNAIGYYTQNPTLSRFQRLDPADFQTGEGHYPITAYCQDNNILIITEGASTADLNSTVKTFIETAGQNDTDSEDNVDCGALSGSTFLDDLTSYAHNSTSLHELLMDDEVKKNITTHIVVAGTLRSTGTNECSPDLLLEEAAREGGTTLYTASNPAQLEDTLRDAFYKIRAGAAAGSAASVISSSRGGEGATYQAIFWPDIDLPNGDSISWIGEVHSLLVDEYGYLHEDTNDNNTLDMDIDQRVIFYYDEASGETMACNGVLNSDGTCNGASKDLDKVHYLWSAAEWLASVAPTASDSNQDILVNRSSYISAEKKRYIFTWDDLDNDGIVDDGERLAFDTTNTDWGSLTTSSRGPVNLDFGVQTIAEVNEIINWIRGLDQEGLRSRQRPYDFDHDGTAANVTWRLGDVVHSTPMSVSSPSEGFHLLYRDSSYAQFVARYKGRRHVIYFGGNDGMLHAVNGGFYKEQSDRFCRNGDCTDEDVNALTSPELGAELWAYVPYNLLPHLKCLRDAGYEHKYYVDQRARMFDVRIFDPNDGIHTGGWGTILVGAMGFGGAKIQAGSLDLDDVGGADNPTDNREFTSAFFILDITDPESPPVLLGEMTRTTDGGQMDFGFTKAIPTIVTMTNGLNVSDTTWYLIMGSGPTDLDGKSTQNARVAVLPLSWLVGASPRAFRIPDTLPSVVSNEGGCFTLSDANSFISDLITVDFDLDGNYKGDVVYFGTVSGTWGAWGGDLYRLVTRKLDVSGNQIVTKPSDWPSLINPLDNPLPLINVGQPITAAPTVGYDNKNFWVYFGTGRFFDGNDKSDSSSNAQQTYYGIKEPMSFATVAGKCTRTFTWEGVELAPTGGDDSPGGQGLLRVDQIRISAGGAVLSCDDGTTDCLPIGADGNPISNFIGLKDYIAGTGTGCGAGDSIGTDGWYKHFSEPRERNLGEATLLGGLVSFTTYQPYDDVCLPEGLAYIYGVYYQTGTAYYPDVFGIGADAQGNVIDRIELGRGLATTPNLHVGKHKGTKAFVQTSTGAIVEVEQPGTPESPGSGLAGWSDEE